MFTLNRIAFELEQKPYQIGLLFTHTCKNGDFGERTQGHEAAMLRRADLYKMESHIWIILVFILYSSRGGVGKWTG